MPMKKFTGFAKAGTKSKAKRTYKRAKKTAPLKTMIQNEIRKTEEGKRYMGGYGQIGVNPTDNTNLPSSAIPTVSTGSLVLTPVIQQGTSQENRIGNKLRIRDCIVRWSIAFPYFTQATQPAPIIGYYDIVFYRMKYTTGDADPNDWTQYLQGGSNDSTFISSTLISLTLPNNTDLFTIYKRIRVKLGNSDYAAAASADNNDFSYSRYGQFSLARYFQNREVLFDDGTSVPMNCPLYMTAFVVPLPEGFPYASISQANFPNVTATAEWIYSDA